MENYDTDDFNIFDQIFGQEKLEELYLKNSYKVTGMENMAEMYSKQGTKKKKQRVDE